MARTAARPIYVVLMGLCASFSGTTSAQLTNDGVQVGVRMASFLLPPPRGTIVAAVVFEPGNIASENEARAIEHAMGGGLSDGSIRLAMRRVPTNDLDALAGARIAFVTSGTGSKAIASAAIAHSVLTISSDNACAYANLCTVSISSAPRVQIIVNRAVCNAAKLKFSAAFLMLVKEI